MTFAEELRQVVGIEPITRRPTPTTVQVLEVMDGIDALVAAAAARNFFVSPYWTEMQLPGATPHEQMLSLIRRRADEDLANAAIWTQGTWYRVFILAPGRIVHTTFVVGRGLARDDRLEWQRAMWDIGVEAVYGYMKLSHPVLARARVQAPDIEIRPHETDPDSVTLVFPVSASRLPRP